MNWPAISGLVAEIKTGKHSAVETVRRALDQIEATKDYHAILEINPEALKQAEAIDQRIKKGDKSGKLLGVPYVAKDVFLTRYTHTTAASNILRPFKSPFQSTAVERLQAEGAIMLGKANNDAFGHGTSTENSDFGVTKNPHDPTRVPGGSSGGSAASVALGQVPFSLAEDTGGSIRLPANYCGVVGLKPTYGLISRYGVVAMASSADTVGPICRSVEDTAYVLDILAANDPLDATTIERDSSSYTNFNSDIRQLKVGIIKQHVGSHTDTAIKTNLQDICERLRQAGTQVNEFSIPVDELALAAYYIIIPAEISSNLARYDGIKYGHHTTAARDLNEYYEKSRSEGFGGEAKRRIMIGTYVLSSGYYDAYYKKAQAVRTLLINEYQQVFNQVDVLIDPVSPSLPFKFGAKQDPLAMYLTDIFTVQPNLLGIPSIAIPTGKSGKLPLGIQVMGPQRSERMLLGVASAIEKLVSAEKIS